MQELFTGRPAYPELPVHELWHAVQSGASSRLSGVEPELARLLEELKSHDPKRRPAAVEVAERLAWIAGQPARRRRRRWLAVSAVAAVVGLAAGLVAMSWLAFEGRRARLEAERRQGQAEDLIGFMLGDLRPKLERAGRLELLDAVGERALDYFESVPESELSIEELVRRVEALRQLSEVRSSAGELDAAIDVARRAVALGRELVARAGEAPAPHLALARAHAALGAALLDSVADPAITLAEFDSELAAARAAAAIAPDDPEVRRQLGAAYADVGVGHYLARQLETSAARFDDALAILEPAAAGDRETPGGGAAAEELANALAWASSAFEALGRLSDATAARRRNLEIQATLLARAPDDAIAAHDLATARDFHARLLMWQGELGEALTEQHAAVAEFERLRRLDPDNADWERSDAVGRGNLGWILAEAGRLDDALVELLRSRAAHDALRRRDPTHRAWARMSGVTALRIATVVAERGDAGRAAREISRALSALAPLSAADPGDAAAAQRLGEALALDAELAAARGRASAARATRERALELLAPFAPATGNPSLAALWVQLLLALDRVEEARPVVERLRESGFRMRRYRAAVERAGL
jgi:tetratricopeptide (TPR) repeat protein